MKLQIETSNVSLPTFSRKPLRVFLQGFIWVASPLYSLSPAEGVRETPHFPRTTRRDNYDVCACARVSFPQRPDRLMGGPAKVQQGSARVLR